MSYGILQKKKGCSSFTWKKRFFLSLLCFLLVLGSTTHAQSEATAEDLKNEARELIRSRKFEAAEALLGQAIEQAQDDSILIGNCWVNLGSIQLYRNQYAEAVNYFQRALQIRQEVYPDTLLLAGASYNLGLVYKQIASYDQSMRYLLDALRYFESLGDEARRAHVHNVLGNVYRELHNYDLSIQAHESALLIRQRLQDKRGIAASLNNLGETYLEMEYYDQAEKYFQRSLQRKRNLADSLFLASGYYNLGRTFLAEQDLEQARTYFVLARDIRQRKQERVGSGYCELFLGRIATQQRQWSRAGIHLQEALEVGRETGSGDLEVEAYEALRHFHEARGELKAALENYDRYTQRKERILNEEKQRAISDTRVKYEAEKKERENAVLAQENALKRLQLEAKTAEAERKQLQLVVALLLAGLIFGALLWIYRQFRQKKKSEERISRILRETHHRIKNNLQSLSGLFSAQLQSLEDVAAQNAVQESRNRVLAMTYIHDDLQQATEEALADVGISDYLRRIVHNLILAHGHADKFSVEVDIPEIRIDVNEALPLGLIVNETVTNSLKYAVTNERQPHIYLGWAPSDSGGTLCIRDNGPGFDLAEAQQRPQSVGLKLITALAEQIGAHLEWHFETGTEVRLSLQRA
ncbi:MAG: tetratricopeptide repeat protein [Leptolyngbya sp. SIO3F4]|nr:tetratricopeptide repeat protein [Leptolyngbya sp. SIO3F4]